MIASKDVIKDFAFLNFGCDFVADNKIIDAPAGVIFSRVEPVTPPRIFDFIGVKVTEGIRVSLA